MSKTCNFVICNGFYNKIIVLFLSSVLICVVVVFGVICYFSNRGEPVVISPEHRYSWIHSWDYYQERISQHPSNKVVGKIVDAKDVRDKADAIFVEIYGEETMKDERPYEAIYLEEQDVWIVEGTLKDGYVGGVATILIIGKDGKVLAVWHTK